MAGGRLRLEVSVVVSGIIRANRDSLNVLLVETVQQTDASSGKPIVGQAAEKR